MSKKLFYSFIFVTISLAVFLCGCQTNKPIDTDSKTEHSSSEQTSTTIAQEDIDLINKNAQYLSNSLNMQMDIAHLLAEAMCSVGVSEIDTITELGKDDKTYDIEIVDIKQDKYFLCLSPEGFLGLIFKDEFGGQPIYCKVDD